MSFLGKTLRMNIQRSDVDPEIVVQFLWILKYIKNTFFIVNAFSPTSLFWTGVYWYFSFGRFRFVA
jgi:hypothetical protein